MNDKNFNIKKIGLKEDDNPDFYKLISNHNVLISEWDRINKIILSLKIHKLCPFKSKTDISSILNNIGQLQIDYKKWENSVIKFLDKPKLIFEKEYNSEVSFLYFTERLSDIKINFSFNMNIIANNCILIQESYRSKVNFLIAIISASISTIGLIIAILTIFFG